MHKIFHRVLLACGALWAVLAHAEPLPVVLSLPGPGSLTYLPVELAKKIGADRAEGVDLKLRYFSGGPLAVRDLLEGHSDFAVLGAPALADAAANGEPVVSIASITHLPAFVLMVRKDLEGRVKDAAGLEGRVIGVNSSNVRSRSTSQQMAEFVLRRAGVDPAREANFIAAGQTLEEQRAAFASGAVDALMGDEPFASRLREEGLVFYLLDLHDPKVSLPLLGGHILYAQLATRRDVLRDAPQKAERVARMLRRTLAWMARATPEAIVARLAPSDPAMRKRWVALLRRHKAIYSADGAFSREQIATLQAFYRANAESEKAARYDVHTLIEPRFVGWKSP